MAYDQDKFMEETMEMYEEGFDCWHIGIVSISETECQCMDCLRIWPKEPGFRSDWPEQDRG